MITDAELDEIEPSFRSFHTAFCDLFSRRDTREKSYLYVRALLTQDQERRSAENLAEVVPVSARSLQRFLTNSEWSHRAITQRLQQTMAGRLNDVRGVFVVDESGFGKQGKMSVGVARQYSGTLGRIGNCQIGCFLAYVSPRGRLLIDKELYLPQSWTKDPARCDHGGVPKEEQTYCSKTQLALRMLRCAKQIGAFTSPWVTGDDHYGQSPDFRDGVSAEGFDYVLEVPRTTPVWPARITWKQKPYSGSGRPPLPAPEQHAQSVEELVAGIAPTQWQRMTVAEGSQGPREYLFCFKRMQESREKRPGEQIWVVGRKNLDGTEMRYYFSNASAQTPFEELAYVASARWPIETEFEETKSHVGLDEYEVRSWRGWHHHITLCLLANAFLLTLEQDAKKKSAPDYASSGVPLGPRTAAPADLDTRGSDPVAYEYPRRQRTIETIACETAS